MLFKALKTNIKVFSWRMSSSFGIVNERNIAVDGVVNGWNFIQLVELTRVIFSHVSKAGQLFSCQF